MTNESIWPIEGELIPAKDRDGYEHTGTIGLTKRELFAGMAMQGLLSAVYSSKEMLNDFTTNERGKYPAHLTGRRAVSENAVSYADALIAELAKEQVK